VILLAFCSARVAIAEDKLQFYTVNHPLAYFAERISGDLAKVTFPEPPDVDPAFWMPDPETVATCQAAEPMLLNGADCASGGRVRLPCSRLVDSSRAFQDAYIRESDGVSHSHGPSGTHNQGGVAVHPMAGTRPKGCYRSHSRQLWIFFPTQAGSITECALNEPLCPQTA